MRLTMSKSTQWHAYPTKKKKQFDQGLRCGLSGLTNTQVFFCGQQTLIRLGLHKLFAGNVFFFSVQLCMLVIVLFRDKVWSYPGITTQIRSQITSFFLSRMMVKTGHKMQNRIAEPWSTFFELFVRTFRKLDCLGSALKASRLWYWCVFFVFVFFVVFFLLFFFFFFFFFFFCVCFFLLQSKVLNGRKNSFIIIV